MVSIYFYLSAVICCYVSRECCCEKGSEYVDFICSVMVFGVMKDPDLTYYEGFRILEMFKVLEIWFSPEIKYIL